MDEIRLWDDLSRQEQNLFVTLLWKDGYSEGAIGKFLGTTKNRIVRRRRTLKLTTEGRPSPKSVVSKERFEELLKLYFNPAAAKAPPSL